MNLYVISKSGYSYLEDNRPADKKSEDSLFYNLILSNIDYKYIDNFSIEQAVKDGYHIVSIAYIGMTIFSSICQYWISPTLNQQSQEIFVESVNSNKETGTLFPMYKMTILPYRYRTTAITTIGRYDYTNGKDFNEEEIKSHLRDAFNAETQYIKSKKMYFCFLDLHNEVRIRYVQHLLELLKTEYQDYELDIYIDDMKF